MQFNEIIGHYPTQKHLAENINKNRIPHAQIFFGPEGSGALSMAFCYANLILNNKVNNNGQHPDLHFVFPVATSSESKTPKVSDDYIREWHQFLAENKYGTLQDWMQFLDLGKKQGNISVHETASINKKLSLKAYEGGYKIMIIWHAEKMNTAAANKLLKNLEEPPEKTVFLLIVENRDDLLQTIKSRCQEINLLSFTEENIIEYLQKNQNATESNAKKIAQQCEGNLNKALHLFKQDNQDVVFEQWFIYWVRAAFKAIKQPGVINDLLNWSADIAKENRETQINFLQYCIQFFRQALLVNYKATSLVYLEPNSENFKIANFAPFVHGGNIKEIYEVLNTGIYHIERNGSGIVILTDISIKLTKLLHIKE
jgi:DNA polymerase III subunit delta'